MSHFLQQLKPLFQMSESPKRVHSELPRPVFCAHGPPGTRPAGLAGAGTRPLLGPRVSAQ